MPRMRPSNADSRPATSVRAPRPCANPEDAQARRPFGFHLGRACLGNILIGDRRIPGGHMCVATSALSDFGNDVGIDQIAHRSTSRPGSGRDRDRFPPAARTQAAPSDSPWAARQSAVEASCALRPARGSDRAEATRRTRLASSLRTLTSTRTKPCRSMRARWLAREDFALRPHSPLSGFYRNYKGERKRAMAPIGLWRRHSAHLRRLVARQSYAIARCSVRMPLGVSPLPFGCRRSGFACVRVNPSDALRDLRSWRADPWSSDRARTSPVA